MQRDVAHGICPASRCEAHRGMRRAVMPTETPPCHVQSRWSLAAQMGTQQPRNTACVHTQHDRLSVSRRDATPS
eukprot:2348702-Prymnesium_polylepis.1